MGAISGRIRVIDVVRRGRKMNGTKETRGWRSESVDESERGREREGGEEDWTTLEVGERVG